MNIKNHVQQLNSKDRLALMVGGIFISIYLAYAALIAPLSHAVNEKTQRLIDKQQTLSWMKKARLRYTASTSRQSLTSAQLLSVLAEQLNEGVLKTFPYQLQQTGTGELQLQFAIVPYNEFIHWLLHLTQHYQVTLKQLALERAAKPGQVKVELLLSGFS